MIVLSGIIADDPIRLLCVRLKMLGFPYVFVDQMTYPAELKALQEWGEENTLGGVIAFPDGTTVAYEDITGVYIRHSGFVSPQFHPDFDGREQELIKAQHTMSLACQFDYLPCAIANPLRNGFPIPRTLVTTVPDRVLAFRDECGGKIIYKGASSNRSIVKLLDSADLDRLPLVRNCPVQFQEYIDGSNIRVHVVGDRVFALRIQSAGVDYRYCARQFESISLPEPVERQCLSLSQTLGLCFSGIDLIERDGAHYCLEVNPSPGFSFYELRAHQPISVALAEFLRDGKRHYRDRQTAVNPVPSPGP